MLELEDVFKMLNKAERLLELRIQLGFKFVHQLEAADAVFNLAMLAGEIEKAERVASMGEEMALVRCGDGRLVEDWRRKKANPMIYMLG